MSHTPQLTGQDWSLGINHPVTTLNTQTLFARSTEIVIYHRGEPYRLQLTRNDKLILIK